MGGAEQILGVIGPLSTSIAGIKLFMQTLIDAQPWLIESSLTPLPWRSNPADFESSRKKIRVAVMTWDGTVQPHPPVQRALEEVAIKMLANELVEVTHWEPSGSEEAWEIIVCISQYSTQYMLTSSSHISSSLKKGEGKLTRSMLPASHGGLYQVGLLLTTRTSRISLSKAYGSGRPSARHSVQSMPRNGMLQVLLARKTIQ